MRGRCYNYMPTYQNRALSISKNIMYNQKRADPSTAQLMRRASCCHWAVSTLKCHLLPLRPLTDLVSAVSGSSSRGGPIIRTDGRRGTKRRPAAGRQRGALRSGPGRSPSFIHQEAAWRPQTQPRIDAHGAPSLLYI